MVWYVTVEAFGHTVTRKVEVETSGEATQKVLDEIGFSIQVKHSTDVELMGEIDA
jgi:hypothetical protein